MKIISRPEFAQIMSVHPLTIAMIALCLAGIIKCVWTDFNTLFFWRNENHKIVFLKENMLYLFFLVG